MKKLLAALLAAMLLLTLSPAALMEEIIAPVEMIDETVPETDSVELDFVEQDGDAELPVEAGLISGDSYQAELPSFEETGNIPIDEAHFPDPVFRSRIHDNDGMLTETERAGYTEFLLQDGITSVQGIEYFPNLVSLDVGWNSGLTELDVSHNTKLSKLICNDCSLTTLDVSNCPLLVGIVDDAYLDGIGYSNGEIVLHYDTSKVTLTAGSKVIEPFTSPVGGTPATPSTDEKPVTTPNDGPSTTTPTVTAPADENAIPIDEAHFPDPIIRHSVSTSFFTYDGGVTKNYYDANHDGWLDTGEIAVITAFSQEIYPLEGKYGYWPVTDLRGLEYLTALENIKISNYSGTTLDLTPWIHLKKLELEEMDSPLTSVSFPASMKEIYIGFNND